VGSEAATPAAPVVIAEIAARAAQETDGVVALDGGPLGALATYGRGRRIRGVTIARRHQEPTEVTVRVNAAYGALLPALGAAVRSRVLDELAAAGVNEDVRIEVAIVGVVNPGDSDAPALPA
jgi:uncharacterized alkaline shock family protein YloU